MTLPSFMDAYRPVVRGTEHMVSAGHYLAANAANEILLAGGNAIDAGVAGGLVLGVVQSELVNVAGVAPIMIYLAEQKEVVTIAGLGGWPALANLEFFQRECAGEIPESILRTVVPAAPAAWIKALRLYGRMSFSDIASSAIRYARDGFVMYPLMAELLHEKEEKYARFQSNREIYLPDGRPPAVGDMFVQTDLGRSLQYMADEERVALSHGATRDGGLDAAHDAFYRGDIAKSIVDYHIQQGGLLRHNDLAAFDAPLEPAVCSQFNGIDVYACGPWTQGPIMLQCLQLLKGFDLQGMGHNSAEYIHTITEAFKLAAADRERYYGDPNFVDVPIDALLSDRYADLRRNLIDTANASPEMPAAGDPEHNLAFERHGGQIAPKDGSDYPLDTSYLCVIDGAGNIFSATPSDTSYDTEVIPGTGLCPSSRGSQYWVEEGHPSNVASGKRGRLTPNPAIAIKSGDFALPLGTPGGDVQCQAMIQTLLNISEFGMNAQAAVEAPRFAGFSFPNSFMPHAYLPGRLYLEGRLGDRALRKTLSRLGHDVENWRSWDWKAGAMCIVRQNLKTGVLEAGADPRRACYAIGH
jgi:gamma-glutamyltranspeptidase/glutathione hydrolase